jgi:hypothetical protein
MKQRALSAGLTLVALSLYGCGGGDSGDPKKLPTVKAAGTATFEDGQPVANVRIILKPIDGAGYTPGGNLNEQGKFQLSTHATNDGAPAGKYKVYFTMIMQGADSGPPTAAGPTEKGPTGPPVNPATVVAKEYLSADESPLTVEIPAGGKEDITLDKIKRAGK